MKAISNAHKNRPWLGAMLFALVLACTTGPTGPVSAHAAFSEGVSSTADDAKQKLENASKTAVSKMEALWREISESQPRHRTRDELVAALIMGLLVAGLLQMITGLNRPAAVIFGLIGAVLGGAVAHVTQLNLGLGPVLIRYEDLLLAFIGSLVLVLGIRLFMSRKKEPKKSAPRSG